MKKLLLTSFGLALATVAFGQGTVRFSNVSADLSSPPDRLVRFGTNLATQGAWTTNSGPVVNWGSHSYRAQLYYGASTATEGQLIPLTAAPALFRSSTTTAEPGTWAPGNRTFVGFDTGATVNIQVRVWDNFYGSTFELGSANGDPANLIGRSGIFQYTIPTDPLASPAAFVLTGFGVSGPFVLVPVPEPTTLALAGLGIAGLLIFRRRAPLTR
jgi:hypothetical protein